MERLLSCSNCGEKIVVSSAQAGQEVQCSSCGTSNIVPTLRGLANLPVANHESAQQTTKSQAWGWRGPVTALCLAGLLGLTIFSGIKFYDWWQFDTKYTADMNIEFDSAQIDQVGLDSLLLAWEGYSKAQLGTKQPPAYKVFNDFSKSSLQKGIVGSALILLLSGILVVTLKSAKSVNS